MTNAHTWALRAGAFLWVVWGLVHMLAGVMILTLPTAEAFAGIADAVDPELLEHAYHEAVGAVLHQHGWNLGWVGLTTLICAPLIWRGTPWAIFLAALTGGLVDLGYFMFIDLGGYANFVPGTVMTIFSATAIVLSFGAHFFGKSATEASAAAGTK